MIKVTDKLTKNDYFFPKVRDLGTNTHIIKLYGIGEEEYELSLIDSGDYSDFYVFNADFKDIPDGEYKYIIDDYEKGLIIVGDLTVNSITPNDKDTYNQYENKEEIIYYE